MLHVRGHIPSKLLVVEVSSAEGVYIDINLRKKK